MTDGLVVRALRGPGELGVFRRLSYVLDGELADDLEAGRRRPEWLWVALRDGRVVARCGWWARAGDAEPRLLDVFDLADEGPAEERVADGVRLLRTAMAATVGERRPEYSRFVPAGWRDDVAARRAVEERMAALERLGARLFVERLRLEWRPVTPVPEGSGRLVFRAVRDRAELVGLMARALEGTLDAHDRDELTRMPAREAAVRHYEDELARYTSPRAWWRIATLPGGEPVGFVLPARNDYHAIIAYLAVLPEHRGNGYVHDLLAAGTRVLAGPDGRAVPRIRAATDLGNGPMADAFSRAGYVNFERELTMTWGQEA